MKQMGLIINPIAGMGGTVGLKGTDGNEILRRAQELGAVPQAHKRAEQALAPLTSMASDIVLLTFGDTMGEAVATACGLRPQVIGSGSTPQTTPNDTSTAARLMAAAGVDLLLFVGGDGTARDVCGVVGTNVTALGVPAGVKIHSAVFAASPAAAGQVAASVLSGDISRVVEAEVMDINEEDYRQGILSARLYGYLTIPDARRLLQGLKAGSSSGERTMQLAIATELAEQITDDRYYIVGPGTTCRPFMELLGLDNSLLGVDLVRARRQIGKDMSEREILAAVSDSPSSIIVTPVGGQGFLLGRGNQQISPGIIERVGRDHIIVISTPAKLKGIAGEILRVDTGDTKIDDMLRGYIRVVTDYNEMRLIKIE